MVEWSTVGTICGIVSIAVGGIVTASTVYLRLFMRDSIHQQNEHILSEVRRDFIRKDVLEEKMKILEERIAMLREKLVDKD